MLFFIIFISFSSSVTADGGIFWDVDYDRHVYLPDQKAVILWDGYNETLTVSSKFTSENITDLAWIIPIVSSEPPNVTAGDTKIFQSMAEVFGEYHSIKNVISSLDQCYLGLFLLIISCILLIIGFFRRKQDDVTLYYVTALCLFIVSFFVIFTFFGSFMFSGQIESGNVDVIEMKKVDIYDIAILRSSNATDIINWMNQNNYFIHSTITPILQGYCNESNIYFIVNRINLSNTFDSQEEMMQARYDIQQGIATPLQITFQPKTPFYPLKMTAVNSGNVTINVYVLSDTHMSDSSSMLSMRGVENSFVQKNAFDAVVTWFSFEGNSSDLTGDSFFVYV
jgi:hypothetical protein